MSLHNHRSGSVRYSPDKAIPSVDVSIRSGKASDKEKAEKPQRYGSKKRERIVSKKGVLEIESY